MTVTKRVLTQAWPCMHCTRTDGCVQQCPWGRSDASCSWRAQHSCMPDCIVCCLLQVRFYNGDHKAVITVKASWLMSGRWHTITKIQL